MNDYIVNTPEGENILQLPEPVLQIIGSLNAIWPSFPMVGTIPANGRKLVHVRMLNIYTKAQLEAMFVQYFLDWDIYSSRTVEKIDGEYIIEFLAPKENFIPFIEVYTTGPIYFSTFAGTDPIELL